MTPEIMISFIKHNNIDIKKTTIQEIVNKYNESQLFITTKAAKEAVTFLTKENAIVQFQVGKTYKTNSICDSNCWSSFTIERRTEQSVWIDTDGGIKRRKVEIYEGVESIYPHGKYSMCMVLKATHVS